MAKFHNTSAASYYLKELVKSNLRDPLEADLITVTMTAMKTPPITKTISISQIPMPNIWRLPLFHVAEKSVTSHPHRVVNRVEASRIAAPDLGATQWDSDSTDRSGRIGGYQNSLQF
jgi:hypothetical protein